MTETFVIEAGRAERQYWRDLWRFRELFYFLAWRDFLIRYKQTVVGIAWSLIRPFLMMLALTMVVRIGKLPTGGVPYPLFVFCGLLPWQFFSTALSESGNSLVTNSNLVSKIYFPRLVVPTSSVIVNFVDFLISAIFLAVLMFYFHFVPPSQIVFIPLFVVLIFAASLGTGFWIAALTVEYRDFRFVIPFIVQFGIFVSGVFMMTSHVPERWRLFYSINPVVGIIDGFRWCILGGGNVLYVPGLVLSILVTFLLIFSGLWYFRKTERTFADVI
ncbi:MAG TPA: ABC transporter permease [Verrucomicrobiae bacterium]